MSSVTIRKAVVGDAERIATIWLQGLAIASGDIGPAPSSATEVFQSRIATPLGKSDFWVAEADGKIIGWQNLTDFGYTSISRFAQSSTYIDAAWHSCGIGKLLLQHAQREASKKNLNFVVGWIAADNRSSLRLIESLGWSVVGTLPTPVDMPSKKFVYVAYAVPRAETMNDLHSTESSR